MSVSARTRDRDAVRVCTRTGSRAADAVRMRSGAGCAGCVTVRRVGAGDSHRVRVRTGAGCRSAPRAGSVKNRPTVVVISRTNAFFVITSIGIKSATVAVSLVSIFTEK